MTALEFPDNIFFYIIPYWPAAKVPELLDFFILRGIASRYTQIACESDLSSDYSVLLTVDSVPAELVRLPPITNKLIGWNTYRFLFMTKTKNWLICAPKDTKNELDAAGADFTSMLLEAASSSTTVIGGPSNIQYTHEIRELVKQHRTARKRRQSTRLPP